jgi:hypothetical protein
MRAIDRFLFVPIDEVFFSLQVGLIARVTASSRFFQPEFSQKTRPSAARVKGPVRPQTEKSHGNQT